MSRRDPAITNTDPKIENWESGSEYPIVFSHYSKPFNTDNPKDDGRRGIFKNSYFVERYAERPQVSSQVIDSMASQAAKKIVEEHRDQPWGSYYVIQTEPVMVNDDKVYVGFPMTWINVSSGDHKAKILQAMRESGDYGAYPYLTAGIIETYIASVEEKGGVRPTDKTLVVASVKSDMQIEYKKQLAFATVIARCIANEYEASILNKLVTVYHDEAIAAAEIHYDDKSEQMKIYGVSCKLIFV